MLKSLGNCPTIMVRPTPARKPLKTETGMKLMIYPRRNIRARRKTMPTMMDVIMANARYLSDSLAAITPSTEATSMAWDAVGPTDRCRTVPKRK